MGEQGGIELIDSAAVARTPGWQLLTLCSFEKSLPEAASAFRGNFRQPPNKERRPVAVLEMDPRFIHTFDYLLFAYIRSGRFSDAFDEINKYIRPIAPCWAAADEAIVYSQWGRSQEMKRALAKFAKYPTKMQDIGYLRLRVWANTGQNGKAQSSELT